VDCFLVLGQVLFLSLGSSSGELKLKVDSCLFTNQ
jgi:hypothetical protein